MCVAPRFVIAKMKTSAQIRRERLVQLQEETRLTYAEIGERLGRSRRDSTLYQIVNQTPDSATGRPRAMGDAQARQLEAAFEKPVGWMDRDPDYDALLTELQAREPGALYSVWPFAQITPDRWRELDSIEQSHIEAAVRSIIELVEMKRPAVQPARGEATRFLPPKPRRAA